jgi:CBS domain-containing protein
MHETSGFAPETIHLGRFEMRVKEIMTREVECSSPNATLVLAAQRMRDLDVGCLPVCSEDERLVGVVTDRDIVIRGIAAELLPEQTPVSQVMTQEIRYCYENDNVESAARIMEDCQIRRVAVINDDHRLVGIISLGDIALKLGKAQLTGRALEQISDPLPPIGVDNA